MSPEKRRYVSVLAVRRGRSLRAVAEDMGVARSTLQYWVARAEGQRLSRVDWSDQPRGCRRPVNRSSASMEEVVLMVRSELREHSALGEFGADAIRRELLARRLPDVPCVRTLHRILERRGALDGSRRVRRPAPPPGWYLPDVAAREAELDSFDFVEDLVIEGGPQVDVLTGISLRGSLPCAWPMPQKTAKGVVEALVEHWRAFGCPGYAQFDNDTCFQGPHQHPDTIGRVTRLCLSLQIVPVFAPPRETGFQACIESFNGRWQTKVWARFHHPSLHHLRERSAQYIQAYRARSAARIEAAPERRPFPLRWRLNLQAKPTGRIIYLRRTNEHGRAELLGRTFDVDRTWVHRLVRAEVDLDQGMISFYALRRRDPSRHLLLKETPYKVPQRPFHD